MHYQDAAKYVTETDQPAIFIVLEVSQKWYDSLPKDLQKIVDRRRRHGVEVDRAVAVRIHQEQRKAWTDDGGELISLPPDEQAAMMETLASVGEDVSKTKPALQRGLRDRAPTRRSGQQVGQSCRVRCAS